MRALGRPGAVAATMVLAFGLTACTNSVPDTPEPTSPVVQLGAPGEPNRTLSPDEAAALSVPEHTDADVEFMRMMIAHHDQAIVMTGWVDERTSNRDVRLLAERMRISQEDELEQMASWMQDRGQPLREGGHDHLYAAMPGMLTDEELEQLEHAKGAEFERLFLEGMIRHHQGALEMVEDLWAAGGGNETWIGEFARHVESDQGIEIVRMQQMLAERS